MTDLPGTLLVVQPSADYAFRVRRHVPGALLLVTPERAAELSGHPIVVADLDDAPAAAEAVRRHLGQHGLRADGITCFVCERLETTARVAADLGLPFHTADLVRTTRHKDASLARWQAAGVPIPPTTGIGGLPDLLDFARRVAPPWILKPTDGSGSEWVLRVDDHADLLPAHLRIRDGLTARDRRRHTQEPRYIAQGFVHGREISADLHIDGGRLVRPLRLTEKHLVSEAGLAGLVGAYFPALLDEAEQAALFDVFDRGVRALGIERGIVMVDSILQDGVPHLLEMGLRPGGDCLPDLGWHSSGYDAIRCACQVALGLTPDGPARAAEPIAALHLIARASGRLSHLDLAAVVEHADVLQVEPYRQVGDDVRLWSGSYDDRILAACLARYRRLDDLPALLRDLTDRIDVRLAGATASAVRLPGAA